MASPDDDARLQQLAADIGLEMDARTRQRLIAYLDLLSRWNSTYNLTAVRDPESMWSQHLADCLAVLPSLDRRTPNGRLLDVGSGGGLPGVVIATTRPALDVTCIDTVGKKAAFIRQAAGALGLPNLHAVHARVEQLTSPTFDLITARAFSSLADLVRLTRSSLGPGGHWMAMKGQHPQTEIEALPADIAVFHVERLAVPGLAAERCLVWMRLA